MDWLTLVEEKCSIKIEKWKRFLSRRNKVFYVEGIKIESQPIKYAVKIYCQGENFQEPFILEELSAAGVKVPKIIWYNENIMVTEYIAGITLAELMVEENVTPHVLTDALARWLYRLHSVQKAEGYYLSMPDLNLRNFIFNGKDFIGLDFEELVFNYAERDLGGIAAFILNSDPMFVTWKFAFVRQIIEAYMKMRNINQDKVSKYFFEEMEKAAERRDGQRVYLQEKIRQLKDERFLQYLDC